MSSLTGTGMMVRAIVRRDRVRLSVWVGSIALAVMGSVASFSATYPTAADRQARAEVLDNPMMSLFLGPRHGLANYTYGAMTSHEMLPLTSVVVALMSIFLVVRNTRAEEESGRYDVVRALVVGRHAPMAATLIVVGGAVVTLGVALTLGLPLSLSGLSTRGSLAFGAALVGVGLVFAGFAALVAQVTVSARAALGLASTFMGAAYVVRAVGDMGNGALSWLSPFGWATETRPFVGERWWALLLPVALASLLVAAAIAVEARRDVGAGLLADRRGPATAAAGLRSSYGLARRLQRATLAWWAVSLFLLGAVYGAAAKEAATLYDKVSGIEKYLQRVGVADPADQYLALTLFISALIAAGYVIQSALRVRGEETSGRVEPLLAGPVSRTELATSHLVLSMGGGVVLLLAYGLGEGVARAISISDAGQIPRMLGAALAYAPALWVFAGIAIALFGCAPRATGAAWAILGVLVFMGFFGPLLQLPDWIYNLSPVEHVPRLPVASLDVLSLVVLTAVSAALVALGLYGFRRREVGAG